MGAGERGRRHAQSYGRTARGCRQWHSLAAAAGPPGSRTAPTHPPTRTHTHTPTCAWHKRIRSVPLPSSSPTGRCSPYHVGRVHERHVGVVGGGVTPQDRRGVRALERVKGVWPPTWVSTGGACHAHPARARTEHCARARARTLVGGAERAGRQPRRKHIVHNAPYRRLRRTHAALSLCTRLRVCLCMYVCMEGSRVTHRSARRVADPEAAQLQVGPTVLGRWRRPRHANCHVYRRTRAPVSCSNAPGPPGSRTTHLLQQQCP
jgi:hypothetical protein